MEIQTTGRAVIGQEELRRAADILRRYKQGKQNLERRVIADEDWWKLRQWRQMDGKQDMDGRPASGWLFNVIMGKHADAVAAYPEPNIRPREPDDSMEAQMLSSIIPCILEQNDFEEVYSDTCWQKMKQGTGIWGVFWDQEKLDGLGDISIRPVNVLNLFWEPGITDIQQSKHVFYLELTDNETLLEQYPQLKGKLRGGTVTLAQYGAALLQVCGRHGAVCDGERHVPAVCHARDDGSRDGRAGHGAGAGAQGRVRTGVLRRRAVSVHL